jgi:hypothetical protein
MSDKSERLTMPGQGPTDDDLRQDAELTRQELAQTVSALADKVDVKARAHDKAEEVKAELRERGDELAAKLPEPVRPVVTTATRKPLIPLGVLLALVLILRIIRKRRANND